MPRIKRTLTKSERKMVDDLFKAACKDHNNPTTTTNDANDDLKCKREDPSAADALSANQPDEVVPANATEKEDPTSSDEEDANSLAPQQHTATVTIANPPVTYDKPSNSNSNDRAHKRKSSSGISDNEMESAPKKNRATKSFEQRIDDLRAYKEKHGHVNVKRSENKSLYDPNSPIKSFEQRIADLKAYKEKHGNIKVKRSYDKSLYHFCNHMRRARKNPEKSTVSLTDDRIASLDALGFDWSIKEQAAKKSFEQRIADLKAYKKKHGHVKVKRSEDKSLSDFCYNVRYARINPEKITTLINEERIASLDALGFEWTVKEQVAKKSVEQRMDDLRAYKEKNGPT